MRHNEQESIMITLDNIKQAAETVKPYVKRTPQWQSDHLSQRLNTHVYLKLELFQHSGSFKPRGAFNQMLALDEKARRNGVVAVSGGNFARAVAYVSQVLGVDAIVCMPENAPQGSIAATRNYGAQVELVPDATVAFARADELVEQGRTALHPFDSPNQIAGNGTVGLEIFADCPELTDIVISIGGGGLIAGQIIALKALKPSIRIWGVETEGAPTMKTALAAGHVVNIKPTSLSKTLSAPFVGETALQLCRDHLEELMIVTDQEAIVAQQNLIENDKIFPELAASCTLASADRLKDRFTPDSHVVLLMCGGNDSLVDVGKYATLI
jgi:threonine dehydratase